MSNKEFDVSMLHPNSIVVGLATVPLCQQRQKWAVIGGKEGIKLKKDAIAYAEKLNLLIKGAK